MNKMKKFISITSIALILGLCVTQAEPISADYYDDYYDYYGDYYDYDDYYGDYDDYYDYYGDYGDYDDYYDDYYGNSSSYSLKDGITNVECPSKKKIKKKWKALKMKDIFSKEDKMTTNPVNSGKCSLGKVSDATLKDAVNVLNMYRFVAGVPADVTIDSSWQEYAQAAAVVNCNLGYLSHYPSKPSGMDDSLYQKGKTGAGSSNIAMGYGNVKKAIVGWMGDSDSGNIDRLGHRRWCINPTMDSTGFGIDGKYYAMYAFSQKNTAGKDVHGVTWPAKNTPIQLWDNEDAWSISMGASVPTSTTVTLTRVKDNKTWKFSSNNSSAGYFNINNEGYGQSGCIIFRPNNITYKKGDKFKVKVKGDNFEFEYTVKFFSV